MFLGGFDISEEGVKRSVASVMLCATLLTGCGSQTDGDIKDKSNDNYISVAIILNDNTATIMDVGYYYTSGGYMFVEFSDNSKIAFSNAVIMDGVRDYSEVEELARSLVGEDGEINYYSHGTPRTRKR